MMESSNQAFRRHSVHAPPSSTTNSAQIYPLWNLPEQLPAPNSAYDSPSSQISSFDYLTQNSSPNNRRRPSLESSLPPPTAPPSAGRRFSLPTQTVNGYQRPTPYPLPSYQLPARPSVDLVGVPLPSEKFTAGSDYSTHPPPSSKRPIRIAGGAAPLISSSNEKGKYEPVRSVMGVEEEIAQSRHASGLVVRHGSVAAGTGLGTYGNLVTTTLWEEEVTVCYQVVVRGICVARRADNNMINGTKLLNMTGMTRGRRDSALKSDPGRVVVKHGTVHLKGVWIPFESAKILATTHSLLDSLYPLFDPSIKSFLYLPQSLNRTEQLCIAARQRRNSYEGVSPNMLPSTFGGAGTNTLGLLLGGNIEQRKRALKDLLSEFERGVVEAKEKNAANKKKLQEGAFQFGGAGGMKGEVLQEDEEFAFPSLPSRASTSGSSLTGLSSDSLRVETNSTSAPYLGRRWSYPTESSSSESSSGTGSGYTSRGTTGRASFDSGVAMIEEEDAKFDVGEVGLGSTSSFSSSRAGYVDVPWRSVTSLSYGENVGVSSPEFFSNQPSFDNTSSPASYLSLPQLPAASSTSFSRPTSSSTSTASLSQQQAWIPIQQFYPSSALVSTTSSYTSSYSTQSPAYRLPVSPDALSPPTPRYQLPSPPPSAPYVPTTALYHTPTAQYRYQPRTQSQTTFPSNINSPPQPQMGATYEAQPANENGYQYQLERFENPVSSSRRVSVSGGQDGEEALNLFATICEESSSRGAEIEEEVEGGEVFDQ